MPATDGARGPADAWQTEQVRLTVFSAEPSKTSPRELWERIGGEVPEQVTEKPSQGFTRIEGTYDADKLCLTVRPGRMDWHQAAQTKADAPPEGFPTIGPITSVLPGFVEAMQSWLQETHGLRPTRVAVGAVLLQEVAGHEEGYERIRTYLPFDFRSPGVSDFTYRINRPRATALDIPELRINRLSTWSVVVLQGITLTLNVPSGIGSQHVVQGPQACRLEIDVNTAPEYVGTLPEDRLPGILQELSGLCLEIAAEGDKE